MAEQLNEPAERELRRATYATARHLVACSHAELLDGYSRPTVAKTLGHAPFAEDDARRKCERYAFGARELGEGIGYVVDGDGPTARFRDFVQVSGPDKAERPHHYFRLGVEATFRQAWQHFENDVGLEPLEQARDIYNEMLAHDPSSHATGQPINEDHFRMGVEAGPELAYFGVMVGVARAKYRGKPEAADGLAIARDVMPTLRRRGRLPLKFVFWGRIRYQVVNYGAARLDYRNERWHLRSAPAEAAPYNPDKDPSPVGPTIGCMADLVKIRETDEYSAMENVIWAGINTLHEQGLLEPEAARKTWELHQKYDHSARPNLTTLRHELAEKGLPRDEIERALIDARYEVLIEAV